MASISVLPTEILIQIIEDSTQDTRLNLRLLNKRFNELATPIAFQSIWLVDLPESTASVRERVVNLWQSRLQRHLRTLYLNFTTIAEDVRDSNMLNLTILHRVEENGELADESDIVNLAVCAQKVPNAYLGSYEYDSRLLYGLGSAFYKIRMNALRRFELRVDCPSYVLQMYDSSLVTPRRAGQVGSAMLSGAEPEAFFPNLEGLILSFTSLIPFTGGASFRYLPHAIRLLTTGCSKLKHLDVTIGNRHNDAEDAIWLNRSHIMPFGKDCDPSNIRTFSFEGNARMREATSLIKVLSPMVNLRKLHLGRIFIDPEYGLSEGNILDDWVQVFDLLANMKDLVEYSFDLIGNSSLPEEYGRQEAPDERVRKTSNDWGRRFVSCHADELDALDRLRRVAAKRRKDLGLQDEWVPAHVGSKVWRCC